MKRHLSTNHDDSPRPAKRRPEFGLKELAAGITPYVDIVAIHGINGDREESWTADNGVLWLRDLLPVKIPNARILTYGYDANTHGQEQLATEYMYDHATTFISKLALFREESSTSERPIIFVAHSSGGILLKSALIHSHLSHDGHLEHHRAISQSTFGIAFFSTPHQGSATAELARFLLDINSSSISTSNVLLQHLERDSEALQQQLAQYLAISGQFETKFFYELYDTPVVGMMSRRVVPKSSAVVPGAVNAEAIGINKDHVNMVKFPCANDQDFWTVSAVLSLMVKKGARYKSTNNSKKFILTSSQEKVVSNILRVNAARFDADSRPRCLEGTRVNLIETISKWIESRERHRIFWLCGQAGMGKTTISLTVASDCEEKGHLGASFFFSRDHAEQSDLQLVFPTIAYQLGIFHRPFQKSLAEALERDPDLDKMDPMRQFKKLIVEPVKSCDPFPASTIVVLDALDECKDENPISRILTILSNHIHELPWLKFFITSRPEDHIRGGFNPLSTTTQTVILHDIEASTVDTDIERYVRNEFFTTVPRLYPDLVEPNWPPDESINHLVKQSGRLFIFAATAMNFILDPNYSDPPSQLAILLDGSPAVDTSSSPFAFLDQLYLQVLRHAFPPGTAVHRLDLLRTILGAIVLLSNPLSPGALESLLGLRSGTVKTTLRHLHSVIVIPATDKELIRLIHPSFFDFVTSRCLDANFRIDSSVCHEQLAIACFEHMKGLKRNICQIQDASKRNWDFAERIERYIPPAMRYACLHWSLHLRIAGGSTLQGQLGEFCRGQILYWIEAVSLLGNLVEGIGHLRRAFKFNALSTPSASEDLLEALGDSIRFIEKYRWLIAEASPQLYRSALPLSAPSSYLHKTFHQELYGGVRVLQGNWVDEKSSFVTITLHALGHQATSVDISLDGKLIVSTSPTGEVQLWHCGTGMFLSTLHSNSRWAKFLPDGSRVIAGTSHYTILIWNVATGDCLRTIRLGGVDLQNYALLECYTISSDLTRIIGSTGNDIYIWHTSNGDLLKIHHGHNRVESVACSPNHTLIAFTSGDHAIRIWDAIMNGNEPRAYLGHSESVTTLAFSPDSKYIASGSLDGEIRLWDTSNDVYLKTLKHPGAVFSAAFSADGARIVSGSADRSIRVWGAITGELLKTIHCSGPVDTVGISTDGTQYISTTGGTIYIWDAIQASSSLFEEWSLWGLRFSHDGTYLTGWNNSPGTQHVWNGLTGVHLFSFVSRYQGTLSPNENYLAFGPRDMDVRLWDIASETILWERQMDGGPTYTTNVVFSSDGTRMVLTSSTDTHRILDVASGHSLFAIRHLDPCLRPSFFSPDGSQLIVGIRTNHDGSRIISGRSYILPPHVRSHPHVTPSEQLQYSIEREYIVASNGTQKERCTWIPEDWRLRMHGRSIAYRENSSSSSHGRFAIGTDRGLVLLDLSGINLSI